MAQMRAETKSAGAGATGPLVSVVLPAYNAATFLATALESVFAQTYQSFEILLVDDGSTDGTKRVADDFARAHPDRLIVLQHNRGANRGVAATRNLALARAKGIYIAFLDADDLWYPAKLQVQVRYMERFPEIGLSFTRARIVRQGSGRLFMQDTEILGHQPPRNIKETMCRILNLRLNYVFSTVMVRTSLARNVGGFIENLPYQSEDRIFVAMVAADHAVGRVPRILADYNVTDSCYTASVVLKRRLATTIVLDMQVRMVDWFMQRGNRPMAVDVAARLVPGAFAKCVFRLRPSTLNVVWARMKTLLHHFPHWAVIVSVHYLLLPFAVARNVFRRLTASGRHARRGKPKCA